MHTEDTVVAQLAIPSSKFEWFPRIHTTDEVRGTVTSLTKRGSSHHLHLCDFNLRNIRVLVRSDDLAAKLESRVQTGMVGVQVMGRWERTEAGWLPISDECEAISFVALKEGSIADSLDLLTSIACDGWNALDDPIAEWKKLRGCE
ncbi:hypothetical protein [Luteibacter yeojuensis]|nr:hypothetical protein [Luteibacter yeojuensis]